MSKRKNNNPVVESNIIKYLSSVKLTKNKNVRLAELTDYVRGKSSVFSGMSRENFSVLVSQNMTRMKRNGTVKFVGGRGCGWRLR